MLGLDVTGNGLVMTTILHSKDKPTSTDLLLTVYQGKGHYTCSCDVVHGVTVYTKIYCLMANW